FGDSEVVLPGALDELLERERSSTHGSRRGDRRKGGRRRRYARRVREHVSDQCENQGARTLPNRQDEKKSWCYGRAHMTHSARVREILSWYPSDNPGVRTNLARLLNSGTLAGTGKLVILPVDQGMEHGPDRSFGVNPAANDPDYHVQLALESG